jgi:hypothetical protein
MSRKHDSTTQQKANWGKRIGITAAVFLVLIVLLYLVGTSSAFVKAVILPKVGASMNAKITAGDVSLSPFSRVHIRNLRVETTGTEPLLTADELLVRYSLSEILGGNIKVDELMLNSPVISLVAEPDGKSNLDPILEGPPREEPLKLDLQNFSIKNGVLRQVQKSENSVAKTELQNLNVTMDRLANGQSGKLQINSDFFKESSQGETNESMTGQISANYAITFSDTLAPTAAKGSGQLALSRATGSLQDLSGFTVKLDAEVTPSELNEVALRFTRDGQQLGQVKISGPFSVEKMEGDLRLELLSLDKNILALATAGSGYDFRNSTINSTNQITISQNGTFIAASGNLAGNRISVSQEQLTTPEINLGVNYKVAVNTGDKSARIETLNVIGASNEREFLRTVLEQEMNLSWGEAVKGYKDAAMRLILTNFNLAEWRAVIGTNVQSGMLNSTVSLVSQKDGRVLNADAIAHLANLTAEFGTNRIQNASFNFTGTSTVEDLKVVNIPKFSLALQQNSGPVLQASGAARYQTETGEATVQLSADGSVARLFTLVSLTDTTAASGQLKMSANYTDVGGKRKANGSISIEDFTGKYGEYSFTNFLAAFDYNVEIEKQLVEIHRAGARFARGINAGGNVELKGKYDLEKESGQFTYQTTDLNQYTIAPILTPSLGENRLISISVSASGEARLDPASESTVNTDVKISNWVVQDQSGSFPTNALSAEIKLDGGIQKEVLNLRQLVLTLSPTERAANALQVQAKLDFGTTNPSPSSISILSESLDLTPYYNMFAGGSQTDPTVEPFTPTDAPAPIGDLKPEAEPEPMNLPFQQLAANLKIDRLYLREIAISNWVGNVTIRSNVVRVDPFQLQLNGGAMKIAGNFDVSKPGYIYQIDLDAKDVPLAPLANSLELVNSNQLQGTFLADAQLHGTGVTGPSLKRNLGGQLAFALTNINYTVGGPKIRMILVPISIALKAPELAQTPINWVVGETVISNGVVQVQNASVESEAFLAKLAGTIALENVISNSTINLPMDFSLRRSLAEKSGILPANTPEDVKFASLGNIYSIRGTIGEPIPDPNKTALAGLALRGVGGLIKDEKASQVIGGLGNILSGNRASGTNTSGTTTNSAGSPLGGLVQGLGGLLGNQPAATNAPAGKDTTNSPPRNPLEGLFKSLQGPKENN